MQNITRRLIVWAIIAVFILLIPLLMWLANDFQWNEAVAYAVMLLAIGGVYEMWRWLKTRNRTYRFAFGFGLAGIFLLGWVSGAIGIIGSENNSANLMYWAVFAVWLLGSLLSCFKPRGMAFTLFATALVQLLVPVVALVISPEVSWGNAGVIGVLILNSFFAVPFIISALLFRKASKIS